MKSEQIVLQCRGRQIQKLDLIAYRDGSVRVIELLPCQPRLLDERVNRDTRVLRPRVPSRTKKASTPSGLSQSMAMNSDGQRLTHLSAENRKQFGNVSTKRDFWAERGMSGYGPSETNGDVRCLVAIEGEAEVTRPSLKRRD